MLMKSKIATTLIKMELIVLLTIRKTIKTTLQISIDKICSKRNSRYSNQNQSLKTMNICNMMKKEEIKMKLESKSMKMMMMLNLDFIVN